MTANEMVKNTSHCDWSEDGNHRWGGGRDRDECADCDAARLVPAAGTGGATEACCDCGCPHEHEHDPTLIEGPSCILCKWCTCRTGHVLAPSPAGTGGAATPDEQRMVPATWAGLMSILDEYYPADVFAGPPRWSYDDDPGPRTVRLARALDAARAELAAVRALAEEIEREAVAAWDRDKIVEAGALTEILYRLRAALDGSPETGAPTIAERARAMGIPPRRDADDEIALLTGQPLDFDPPETGETAPEAARDIAELVDDLVEVWHNLDELNVKGPDLGTFLGMTPDQYSAWAMKPSTLPTDMHGWFRALHRAFMPPVEPRRTRVTPTPSDSKSDVRRPHDAEPWQDEFGPYLAEAMRDPEFAAAFHAAERRLLATPGVYDLDDVLQELGIELAKPVSDSPIHADTEEAQ